MTMTDGISRSFAACATPCAWLPDEKATTPRARLSGAIEESLLKATRNLNDPVRCNVSALRKTRAPVAASSTGEETSGVRSATPASLCAAASTSAEVGGATVDLDCVDMARRVAPRRGRKQGGCRTAGLFCDAKI